MDRPNPSLQTLGLPSDVEVRKILHEEALEIREREKRAKSIMIRGMGSDHTTIQGKFNEVVSFLNDNGLTVQPDSLVLTDIVPVREDLVRAKVMNDSHRRELLDKVKILKNTRFDKVHIKRDLTWNQRSALKLRLNARHLPTVVGPTQTVAPFSGVQASDDDNLVVKPTADPPLLPGANLVANETASQMQSVRPKEPAVLGLNLSLA